MPPLDKVLLALRRGGSPSPSCWPMGICLPQCSKNMASSVRVCGSRGGFAGEQGPGVGQRECRTLRGKGGASALACSHSDEQRVHRNQDLSWFSLADCWNLESLRKNEQYRSGVTVAILSSQTQPVGTSSTIHESNCARPDGAALAWQQSLWSCQWPMPHGGRGLSLCSQPGSGLPTVLSVLHQKSSKEKSNHVEEDPLSEMLWEEGKDLNSILPDQRNFVKVLPVGPSHSHEGKIEVKLFRSSRGAHLATQFLC